VSEAAAELDADQHVLRVLLCDDDPVMSEALRDLMLDSPGFELVGVANDADSAATMAETLLPDVVLLDVRMPGGGGPRAARLIRRRVKDARLIAFSAHSDRNTVLTMLRAGASEFLVKGISGDVEILEAMRRTGRGRLGLSQPENAELVSDLIDLLAVTEARLNAANENLLRISSGARDSAANAMAHVESAIDQLGRTPAPDCNQARAALERALSSQRHVMDSLAAALTVADAHAVDAETG
jgi:DNA-binding NarL/FixJ family response regulator